MAKTRYLLMKDSLTQVNSDGNKKIDIFSLPVGEFKPQDVLLEWTLSEDDIYRFDQFIRRRYGSVNLYLEVVKWLNQFFELDERWIGFTIYLPSKRDIDNFFRDNIIKFERG